MPFNLEESYVAAAKWDLRRPLSRVIQASDGEIDDRCAELKRIVGRIKRARNGSSPPKARR